MLSDSAISLTGVSKCYKLFAKPQDRLKQMLFGRSKRFYNEFWALNDVSFEVKKGACVGILGRNGAGKSTLLQIVTGVLSPTSGELKINGRVAALLELGTGFNPEFTGRENVLLNGAILGLRQEEIAARFDKILDFADIGKFIDQPVKTYSSGMMVRLAFAVAAHVDPEILIIDEALAVGDAKFQAKCFRKFQEFREEGKTILFVTHAVEEVIRHCDHAVILEAGRVFAQGEPRKIANSYLSLLFDSKPIDTAEPAAAIESQAKNVLTLKGGSEVEKFISSPSDSDNFPSRPGYNRAEYRWGSKEAEFTDLLICGEKQGNINHFTSGERVTIYAKIKFHREVNNPIYGLTVKTPDGVTVYGSNSRDLGKSNSSTTQIAGSTAVVAFTLNARLCAGHYFLSLGVVEEAADDVSPLDRRYDVFEIYLTGNQRNYGIADLEMTFSEIGRENQTGESTLRSSGK